MIAPVADMNARKNHRILPDPHVIANQQYFLWNGISDGSGVFISILQAYKTGRLRRVNTVISIIHHKLDTCCDLTELAPNDSLSPAPGIKVYYMTLQIPESAM